MTDEEILGQLTGPQALACTMLGEARGDRLEGGSSVEERIAVGCVVRNRLRIPKRFGDSLSAVCFKPKQFSCWNDGDPNRLHLMAVAYRMATKQPAMDPLVYETLYLANGIADGIILDQVNGATHYYSPKAMKPAGRVPSWAKGVTPCARVGGSVFFKGI